MLHGLLKAALPSFPQGSLHGGANDLEEFVTNLEDIIDNADTPVLRRAHCLLLARNYAGHNFDVLGAATSPKGKTFSELYPVCLVNVISTVMYLKNIGEV